MPKPGFVPQRLKEWIEARKRYHLSHAHIQMARELGMHPKSLRKLHNTGQQRWKAPLPIFIENQKIFTSSDSARSGGTK
jgi:hypothetical protein